MMINTIFKLPAYYGANYSDYTYMKRIINKLRFYREKNNIQFENLVKDLTQDELKLILKMCEQIIEESKEWDEWSIITGLNIEELEKLVTIIKFEYLEE
ncbi:hypothetical protein [Aliarcobacter butzleri]|uniref:hypothetical protein n=1 Tax=Aliarcobacter butzleri TaxID=28197 RepID=UPI002B24930D|nr:hypothetical protein [Aliarcobacter butzleri]